MTVLAQNEKLLLFHLPRSEIADVDTDATVCALVALRQFAELSPVAGLFGVQEVPAAVVAAKADPVGGGPRFIAERAGDQMLDLRLRQDFLDLGWGDLLLGGAAPWSPSLKMRQTSIRERPVCAFGFAEPQLETQNLL